MYQADPQELSQEQASPDLWNRPDAADKEDGLLRVLLDSTAEAICGLDTAGICRFANKASWTLLGYSSPTEVIGRSIHEILVPLECAPPLSSQCVRPVSRTLKTGETFHIQDEFCRRKDGTAFPVEYWSKPIKEGGGIVGGIITILDITDRAIRESRLELCSKAIDSALNAIFFCSQTGTILYANQTAVDLWGYEDDSELVGQRISVLTANPDEQQVILNHVIFHGRWSGQVTRKRRDGSFFEAFLTATIVPSTDGRTAYLIGSFVDLTEKVAIEREIQRIEAAERRRIGHDLHDDLGQLLAGLSMKTQVLRSSLGRNPTGDVRIVEEISLLIDGAKSKVRDAARGLSPIPPYDFGLTLALKSLAMKTEAMCGIATCFEEKDAQVVPDPEVRAQLYRIAQEAINNAVQHSGATTITIRLCREGARLVLVIADNGKGFNLQENRARGGLGLKIMQYRAHSINGVLSLSSFPEEGETAVTCSIPVDDWFELNREGRTRFHPSDPFRKIPNNEPKSVDNAGGTE